VKKRLLIVLSVYIKNQIHLDFTQETIASVKTVHDHEFYLVVNHLEPEFKSMLANLVYPSNPTKVHIVDNREGNNVSASWNMGIDYGEEQEFDYVMVPNNDIIFNHKAVDNLIDFAEKHKDAVMWTAAEHVDDETIQTADLNDLYDDHPHFSCFMVSPSSLNKLKEKEFDNGEPYPGRFDENFKPAYFEDGDMHNRILRAGFKAYKTALSLFFHYGSRTIKSDDKLNKMNYHTYEKNRQYFISKWGFDPHGSVHDNDDEVRFKYNSPFNKK
jgi:GT2 family glycosyltransferase